MKINKYPQIILSLLLILMVSCSKDEEDRVIDTNPTNTDVTYNDISELIDDKCLECHGNPVRNQAKISLDTYAKLREAAQNRDLTGRLKSFNNQMPPRPENPLSVSQIELIEGWVLGNYKE